MPDTDFSRAMVISQTLTRVTRLFRGSLVVFMLGLLASVLWFRLGGAEWLSSVASGFAGGIGSVLGLWWRVSQLRRREGGT